MGRETYAHRPGYYRIDYCGGEDVGVQLRIPLYEVQTLVREALKVF